MIRTSRTTSIDALLHAGALSALHDCLEPVTETLAQPGPRTTGRIQQPGLVAPSTKIPVALSLCANLPAQLRVSNCPAVHHCLPSGLVSA